MSIVHMTTFTMDTFSATFLLLITTTSSVILGFSVLRILQSLRRLENRIPLKPVVYGEPFRFTHCAAEFTPAGVAASFATQEDSYTLGANGSIACHHLEAIPERITHVDPNMRCVLYHDRLIYQVDARHPAPAVSVVVYYEAIVDIIILNSFWLTIQCRDKFRRRGKRIQLPEMINRDVFIATLVKLCKAPVLRCETKPDQIQQGWETLTKLD